MLRGPSPPVDELAALFGSLTQVLKKSLSIVEFADRGMQRLDQTITLEVYEMDFWHSSYYFNEWGKRIFLASDSKCRLIYIKSTSKQLCALWTGRQSIR